MAHIGYHLQSMAKRCCWNSSSTRDLCKIYVLMNLTQILYSRSYMHVAYLAKSQAICWMCYAGGEPTVDLVPSLRVDFTRTATRKCNENWALSLVSHRSGSH